MSPHPFRNDGPSGSSDEIPRESRRAVQRRQRRSAVRRRFWHIVALVTSIPALWTVATITTGHLSYAIDFVLLTTFLLLVASLVDWLLF